MIPGQGAGARVPHYRQKPDKHKLRPDILDRALGPPAKKDREWRQGVVSAVNSDGTVSMTLGGSSTVLTSVRCLAGVLVYNGATVWALVGRGDCLVVGVQEVASGWSTSTSGFTAAANFSITGVQWRKIGCLAWLYIELTRTTSSLAVGAGDGNIGNVTMLSSVPAALTPGAQIQGHSGQIGRVITGYLSSGGAVVLAAAAGDGTPIGNGDVLSIAFSCYPVD